MSNKPNPKKLRAVHTQRIKTPTITKEYKDLDARIEWNENIGDIPADMEHITPVGDRGVVIRLYQYTKSTDSDGGALVIPKFEEKSSSNGEITAEPINLDNVRWARRAVIVKIGAGAQRFIKEHFSEEEATQLVPGTSIWFTEHGAKNFWQVNREYPMHTDHSFLCVHPNHIEAIETGTPKVEINYVTPTPKQKDNANDQQESNESVTEEN